MTESAPGDLESLLEAWKSIPVPGPGERGDFHSHSNASDGSYEPSRVVAEGKAAGLRVMALTDHDTLAGLSEAVAAGIGEGMRVVPGVELSCRIKGGTLHILGYFVFPGAPLLEEKLGWLRGERLLRGERIVGRLNELGMSLDIEEVRAGAGDASLGRPHIAQALIDAGHVRDAKEAFDRFLAKGMPAYVDKAVLSKEEAIGAIIASGGVPVMAHPHQTNMEGDALADLVGELVALGLRGMECHYSLHTPVQTEQYLSLARSHGLTVTGGSDFHGPRKPDISLGRGKGNLDIPWTVLEDILGEIRSGER